MMSLRSAGVHALPAAAKRPYHPHQVHREHRPRHRTPQGVRRLRYKPPSVPMTVARLVQHIGRIIHLARSICSTTVCRTKPQPAQHSAFQPRRRWQNRCSRLQPAHLLVQGGLLRRERALPGKPCPSPDLRAYGHATCCVHIHPAFKMNNTHPI